jgi:hypothetical protein
MNTLRNAAVVALAAAAISSTALAQERPSGPAPASPPEMDCRPAPPPTGGTGGTGEAPSDRGASGNPSDKLSQSGGVICPPPNVDRSIQKPAPEQGRTPVIRPPGSPGNNAPMQPK